MAGPSVAWAEPICRLRVRKRTWADTGAAEGYYASFRVYTGAEGEPMRRIQSGRVERYRDGGTTNIQTSEGMFNSPTPFSPNLKASFNGMLEKLNAADFSISEDEETVVVAAPALIPRR